MISMQRQKTDWTVNPSSCHNLSYSRYISEETEVYQTDPFFGWTTVCRLDGPCHLPVLADVDVLVVGGGAAGVAAATVAAEAGKSVILLERYGFCGGAAVAGMSGTICGMYLASDRL